MAWIKWPLAQSMETLEKEKPSIKASQYGYFTSEPGRWQPYSSKAPTEREGQKISSLIFCLHIWIKNDVQELPLLEIFHQPVPLFLATLHGDKNEKHLTLFSTGTLL